MEILWRDEQLVFVLKPAGVPSQPDPSGDFSLVDWISEQVGRKLAPIHRLDRPVGGVVVFGLQPGAVRSLGSQFAERSVRKTYLGVVRGLVEPSEGVWEHFLIKQGGKARVRSGPPAQPAGLDYRVLQSCEGLTLLELEPRTGRFHQIRAQLGAVGLPLLGDARYGARKPLKDRSIALWAHRLEVSHPVTGERLAVQRAPVGEAWERFRL